MSGTKHRNITSFITISNWLMNPKPQRTRISTVTNAQYIENSNGWPQPQVFRAYSMQTFRLTGLLWGRKLTWLLTQAFSFRFLHFAAQFCFHCKSVSIPLEAIWVKFDTVTWFSLINHNILLRIATNEIASFCTDNRLRRMAFLVFAKVGKGRFSSYVERFWNKKASSLVV